jgi:transcriptional regulator with XRE-family HTH domain
MATPRKAPARKPRAPKKAAAPKAAPKAAAASTGPVDSLMGKFMPDLPFLSVVRDLGRWADAVINTAGAGTKVASLVSPMIGSPATAASIKRAGELLRDVRETAGLSIQDLGRAIDLKDATLIEHFEAGKVALPFDVILRIAGVLGRNDPVPFVLRLLRESNPRLVKALEDAGLGKLLFHVGREREFVNLYRGKDQLRDFSDAEFAALLEIVDAAIGMAIVARSKARRGGRPLTD